MSSLSFTKDSLLDIDFSVDRFFFPLQHSELVIPVCSAFILFDEKSAVNLYTLLCEEHIVFLWGLSRF